MFLHLSVYDFVPVQTGSKQGRRMHEQESGNGNIEFRIVKYKFYWCSEKGFCVCSDVPILKASILKYVVILSCYKMKETCNEAKTILVQAQSVLSNFNFVNYEVASITVEPRFNERL